MDILEKIREAGIVGAGGAGFPTNVKLNCKVDYFIVNGLECEPLLQTDKYIMRNFSEEIVYVAEEIGKLVEAKNVYIGLKKEYKKEIDALSKAISEWNSNVKLKLLDVFYPAGDEQTLVYEVTGKIIPPGGIPLNVGAVVSNVATLFNIYNAIVNDDPVTEKFVTVIGEVNLPSIIKVPIGTSVLECIDAAGGAKIKDYGVIMGGPMMGKKLGLDEIKKRYIKKVDGGIIVLPSKHYLFNKENISIEEMKKQARAACIQCHYCTELCPRHLLGHPINPHKIMRSVALGIDNEEVYKESLICCECGVCEMFACPMMLSPKKMNIYVKGLMREKGVRWENKSKNFVPSPMKEYRKIPTDRLIVRLDLNRYKNQNIIEDKCYEPKRVEIDMLQHIGAPAKPCVSLYDEVHKNQKIGEIQEGKLGANIHASIDGTVTFVDNTKIVINVKEGGL